ncbi:sensor histidine kinase [Deinococcus cavernae]|uniref:histidine kinase n=1 Tax=Deinococcus cavernae TaxID=2320857 RepID=A0A418VCQ4_9DEIO|nr:HAMP domain-containing sensor histidine kinase [Deinococcus cavernae]RJF73802.1 sensor histidine kinase [Deinococcus cavernae]
MSSPTGPDPAAPTGSGLGRLSLRTQFTAVIFLLAFLPNLGVTLMSPLRLSLLNLLWILLVGVLSAIMGYFLSGALLQPVSRLEAEVKRRDFGEAHPDDPSEVRSLRAAFKGLLGRLGTEQARRNAFMATLVHDLKTPIIATGHLTHALTTLPLPDAERREVGAHIQAETARLLALVQQMADAHRFERDDLTLNRQPTDLRALLDDIVRRFAGRAEAAGLHLSACGGGHALTDAAVLERAVSNLVENALRYAHRTVVLRAGHEGLCVADDGPGLDLPLDKLAQPFNAQPAIIAGQQFTAGTAGLGLFIARRIAEAHGGHLRYTRVPEVGSDPSSHPPLEHADTEPAPVPFTKLTITLPEVTP